jgi:hypothetical protein
MNRSERMRQMNVERAVHGHCRRGQETPEYVVWRNMIARCTDSRHKSFSRYGGRGIKVCERWEESFEAFWNDMGDRPSPKHSLDRRDNDGDYTKSNCRWSTTREQARNRSNNVLLTHNGITRSVADWADALDIRRHILYGRIAMGWSVERTLGTPSMLAEHKPSSLVGKRFGKLVVLERVANDRHGKSCWRCECDCGSTHRVINGSPLRMGRTRSCGCDRYSRS